MNFNEYLHSRPCTPLTEAVMALYEGYTKSDMALGKHLKSLDGGATIQKPSQPVDGDAQHHYVGLARSPKVIAAILAAGANINESPTEEDLNKIADAMRQLNPKADEQKISGYAKSIGNRLANIEDKDKLMAAAKEYAANNTDAGYTTLTQIDGFNIDLFLQHIRNGIEQSKFNGDRAYMSLNPDPKKSRVMNKWLFHGTSPQSGVKIALHGFDRGNLMGDLAYNNSEGANGQRHNYSGDYLFAFDADDITDDRDDYEKGHVYRVAKYGSAIIMFKGSGYKIYHHGDAENQVIFDYHEPNGCFLIMKKQEAKRESLPEKQSNRDKWSEDYQVLGQGKDGKPKILYAGNGAKSCIAWVKNNGDTYARYMFKWNTAK